jgi:hypothetical protein
MSEIVGRMAIEADFAKRLSRLSSKQRAELRDKLGDPPDPSRVTSNDWARWEQERRQEMAGMLLAIWMLAANQHLEELLGNSRAVGSQRSAMAKKGGDKPRSAGSIANDIRAAAGTGNTGVNDRQHSAMIRQGMAATAKQAADAAASNIKTARDIIDAAGRTWQAEPPSQETIEQVLAQAIGPSRDASTAATEVTKAAVGGTNGIRPVLQDMGYDMTVRWWTRADALVCKFCRPLHLKPFNKWSEVLKRQLGYMMSDTAIQSVIQSGGPPIHPSCRCWLVLEIGTSKTKLDRKGGTGPIEGGLFM